MYRTGAHHLQGLTKDNDLTKEKLGGYRAKGGNTHTKGEEGSSPSGAT